MAKPKKPPPTEPNLPARAAERKDSPTAARLLTIASSAQTINILALRAAILLKEGDALRFHSTMELLRIEANQTSIAINHLIHALNAPEIYHPQDKSPTK